MPNPEHAVREAAYILHDAIMAARAAGLYVQWPNQPEHLQAIAISETKKAAPQIDAAFNGTGIGTPTVVAQVKTDTAVSRHSKQKTSE